jgi:hypothetical protein
MQRDRALNCRDDQSPFGVLDDGLGPASTVVGPSRPRRKTRFCLDDLAGAAIDRGVRRVHYAQPFSEMARSRF